MGFARTPAHAGGGASSYLAFSTLPSAPLVGASRRSLFCGTFPRSLGAAV